MLILKRSPQQSIVIGDVEILVLHADRHRVKLGVLAPEGEIITRHDLVDGQKKIYRRPKSPPVPSVE